MSRHPLNSLLQNPFFWDSERIETLELSQLVWAVIAGNQRVCWGHCCCVTNVKLASATPAQTLSPCPGHCQSIAVALHSRSEEGRLLLAFRLCKSPPAMLQPMLQYNNCHPYSQPVLEIDAWNWAKTEFCSMLVGSVLLGTCPSCAKHIRVQHWHTGSSALAMHAPRESLICCNPLFLASALCIVPVMLVGSYRLHLHL